MMFTQWNLKEAKKDFHLGRLTKFKVCRLMGLYSITLYSIGGHTGELVDYRDQSARTFKDLNSAIGTLENIGFDTSVLELGKND